MRIRLSEEDRERFGCSEWIGVDLSKVSSREAATLQKVLGFDTPLDLAEAWADQWGAKNGTGQEPGSDTPERARLKLDYDAWDGFVWLALRQCGALTSTSRTEMHAELEGIEYEVLRMRLEAEPEPGKAPTSSSTPTTTSTG